MLNIYAQDIAPQNARPGETASRIARLADWWGDARHAMQKMAEAGRIKMQMTGLAVVRTHGGANLGSVPIIRCGLSESW